MSSDASTPAGGRGADRSNGRCRPASTGSPGFRSVSPCSWPRSPWAPRRLSLRPHSRRRSTRRRRSSTPPTSRRASRPVAGHTGGPRRGPLDGRSAPRPWVAAAGDLVLRGGPRAGSPVVRQRLRHPARDLPRRSSSWPIATTRAGRPVPTTTPRDGSAPRDRAQRRGPAPGGGRPPAGPHVRLPLHGRGHDGRQRRRRVRPRPRNGDAVRRAAATVIAVVNLDSLGGTGSPAIAVAGNAPTSPTGSLVASAAAAIEEETGSAPHLASPFAQLLDLGFPFGLFEQAPALAGHVSALTLTTAGDRRRARSATRWWRWTPSGWASSGSPPSRSCSRSTRPPRLPGAPGRRSTSGRAVVHGWRSRARCTTVRTSFSMA